jgi:hypothetical protein
MNRAREALTRAVNRAIANGAPVYVNVPVTDRPLAAAGFTSYRCRNRYGWTMIGATDPDDAMREARRSADDARREDLQVWNGQEYVPC